MQKGKGSVRAAGRPALHAAIAGNAGNSGLGYYLTYETTSFAYAAFFAGIAGIVIWGLHRDTVDIMAIGLPVFSLGALPTGPLRLDPAIRVARCRSARGTYSMPSKSSYSAGAPCMKSYRKAT